MTTTSTLRSGGRSLLAGLIALTLTAAPALAQDVGRMDEIIRVFTDRDAFSGSVLVARGDEILLDRGYGLANREWAIPNDGDTKFRLGSVSKQFTAVAIVQLREQGLVDIDAPIRNWFPDAPASWSAITPRHLLTHTAGVPNVTDLDAFQTYKMQETTPEATIALFRDLPLDFQPGEGWSYSNSGYLLLTAIVEKASGQSYADYLAQHLFRPLGMSDTGYDDSSVILPRRASGYTPTRTRGVINAEYVNMVVPQGAGGLYSTTRDLLKWEQGLFGGRLLTPESLTLLTTPGRNDYAFGLIVKPAGDGAIVQHSGGIEGFNTWMGRDTGSEMTVIVLGNLNGRGPDRIGVDLLTLANGGTVDTPEERQAIALPAETLQAYAGIYDLSPDFAITVTERDGRLIAQAERQPPFELFADGPDSFFLRAIDARVTFSRDASGAVDGLTLHQNGREAPARKR
ncbi:serine hydrolase [Brevundimonas sp. FT23042]|uniref:serine hydrolase n=1 Tax=Brevundimonas sp. FT23042 TaxID=3393749 RepID=UPI003B589465